MEKYLSPLPLGGEEVIHLDFMKDKTILLAEDNVVNQMLFKAIIGKTQAHLDIATNGEEAVECYKQKRYDLILMDINMPVKNGIEALLEIKDLYQQQNYPKVPVVAITANALLGDRQNYINSGMSDCITKPVKTEELYQIFAKYLSS